MVVLLHPFRCKLDAFLQVLMLRPQRLHVIVNVFIVACTVIEFLSLDLKITQSPVFHGFVDAFAIADVVIVILTILVVSAVVS